MSDDGEYPALYLAGIEHFNVCDFYESHEVWEELWTDYQGPSRKFYQGLIQAAVALHHFGNGNIRGARKLYHSTRSYLEPYRPWHMGLDLEQFLSQFETCFAEVIASQEEFPKIEIVADAIPEIHLARPANNHDRLKSPVAFARLRTKIQQGQNGGYAAGAGASFFAEGKTAMSQSGDDMSFVPEEFSGRARLFPLPNLVLFPHVIQPLHIFEPRYVEMFQEAIESDKLIAMSLLNPGWENDYDGRPSIAPVACLGRVLTWQAQAKDRYNLLLLGLSRVRVLDELPPDKPFREANVELLGDEYPHSLSAARPALHRNLIGAFETMLPHINDAEELFNQLSVDTISLGTLTDVVSYALDLNVAVKQSLLAEPNVDRRAKMLLAHLRHETAKSSEHTLAAAFPPAFSPN